MELVALLFSGALNACGALILSPVLPFFAINKAGASALDLAMISSIYSLFQMVSSPLLGTLSDRIGRRPVLLAGLFASAVFYFLQAFAETVPALLASRAALGFAAGTLPAEIAYLTDLTTKEERPNVMGWQTFLITGGALLGPAVGALFASDGFHVLCHIMACVSLLNLTLGVLFFTEPRRPEVVRIMPADADLPQEPFRGSTSRTAALLLFTAFMDCFALAVSDGPEAYFMRNNFGFTEPHLAAFFMVYSASSLVCASFVPWLLKKLRPKVACTTCSLGSAAAMSTLFAFTGPWEPYLYACLSSLMVTVVETVSTSELPKSMVSEEQRGTVYGAESALLNAAFFLGPPLGGFLFEYHSYAPYAVSVACFCLSSAVYALLPSTSGQEPLLEATGRSTGRMVHHLREKAPLPNKNFAPQLLAARARQTWFVDEELYGEFREAQRWNVERGIRKASSIHIHPIKSNKPDLDDTKCLTPH